MLQFISDNLASILAGIAVAAILAIAIWSMRRDKKKNPCGGPCGGSCSGCSGCSYAGKCHENRKTS